MKKGNGSLHEYEVNHWMKNLSPAALKEKSSPVIARRRLIQPNTFSMLEKGECGDLKRALKEAEMVVERERGLRNQAENNLTHQAESFNKVRSQLIQPIS